MTDIDWAIKLNDEFNKDYFIKLSNFLNEEKVNRVTCCVAYYRFLFQLGISLPIS